MDKYKCIKTVYKVYTGGTSEHNKTLCVDCRQGKPCQYDIESEWIKLGQSTIKKRMIVLDPNPEPDSDTNIEYNIRVKANYKSETDHITYDIPNNIFVTHFEKIE